MAIYVDYFIAQNKGVSPPLHLWKTTVLNPSEPEGRVRAPVSCQPWHPGEACGRPVLCWGERLGVAEARMEQALGTRKVCLADVLIPAGPSQAAPAALTPILQATHMTVMLGSLHIPNAKANVHKTHPSSLPPAGILKTSRTAKVTENTHLL